MDRLQTMRHSCAHLYAYAMRELYPSVQLAIGPDIENGFYYDIDMVHVLVPEDLEKIEKKMMELKKKFLKFERYELPVVEAIKKMKKEDWVYKVEMAEDLKKEGETSLSFYRNVDEKGQVKFDDMCRGPHLENMNEIGAFKLVKIAGAYWRGDEKNKMLQRVYGICFETEKELRIYERMMQEAEKRDHRKVGKELELFMNHEYAPGMPFFLPKGMTVMKQLLDFVRKYSYGPEYKEVRTPQIFNVELWKISGHWQHYKDVMFCMHHEDDNIDLAVKPMNCPAHMLIFASGQYSYKDLPLRIAETTTLYRNERSGTLHGLTRVRSLTQDDSHIFVAHEQIQEEILQLLQKIKDIYAIFNLKIDQVDLSTRPESFLGEVKTWDEAEKDLESALKKAKLKYHINAGDGAFYGPKIDVKVKDIIGRQWQLATIQLDFQLPQRFNLGYIDSEGHEKRPVVIHRAILGSFERFLGILIEHFAGAFPFWLAPEQIRVIPVSDNYNEYASTLEKKFSQEGFRVTVDDTKESLGKKIRNAEKLKIPRMFVVGEKEQAEKMIAVRNYFTKQQDVHFVDTVLEDLKQLREEKTIEKN